jgi:DNA-directed RNA polymerase subunit alpha
LEGDYMEPITQTSASSVEPLETKLFTDQVPSMDDIQKLSELVHSTESNLMNFSQQVEANLGKPAAGGPKTLAAGIGLYILGRFAEAAQILQKAADRKEKHIYLGFALRRLGKFDQAIENLQKSLSLGADTLSITLQIAATYRDAGNFNAAAKELKNCANFQNVSAEYHYQLARLQEAQGLYEQAMDNYKIALELAPNHQRVLFHLAYRCDLSGNEEAAIEYYKQIASPPLLSCESKKEGPGKPAEGEAEQGGLPRQAGGGPVYVSALLNLAVLYEDKGEFDNACQCIDMVLQHHPNHQRAILFKKDIESSKTMFYDEEKEKKKTRKNQIMETPISDFELSVRSRNCLKRMNIVTLGDLVRTTEAQLLSYKNFGETSLREIKAILEPKGLRLGQALEPAPDLVGAETLDHSDLVETETEEEEIMNKLVDDLQLSVRARKCLQRLNVRTIGDLTHKTEAELLGCKNFGVTSLNEIKRTLNNLGLSLRSLD